MTDGSPDEMLRGAWMPVPSDPVGARAAGDGPVYVQGRPPVGRARTWCADAASARLTTVAKLAQPVSVAMTRDRGSTPLPLSRGIGSARKRPKRRSEEGEDHDEETDFHPRFRSAGIAVEALAPRAGRARAPVAGTRRTSSATQQRICITTVVSTPEDGRRVGDEYPAD